MAGSRVHPVMTRQARRPRGEGRSDGDSVGKLRDHVANATWLAWIANHTVIPAKAGTYAAWVPAFAGMTILCGVCYVANATWLACIANHTVIPAKAGTYAAWVPAFAGMTILCGVCYVANATWLACIANHTVIPRESGDLCRLGSPLSRG